MTKSLIIGKARGPIVIFFEKAKRDLENHEASAKPNDSNPLSVVDWYATKSKLAGRVEAFRECLSVIDREINS